MRIAQPGPCRSHRRRRLAATTAVELGVQSVNITAWLALNGWALTQESPGVAWGRTTAAVMLLIWTSWNTVWGALEVCVVCVLGGRGDDWKVRAEPVCFNTGTERGVALGRAGPPQQRRCFTPAQH